LLLVVVVGGGCGGVGVWVGVWWCVECWIVDASILICCGRLLFAAMVCAGVCVPGVGCCGEVVEGAWWMSGHQGPMKDVGGRDSPRGVVNRAVIRGCPNGVTRHV
jgi:hypothetical protein